MKIYSTKDIRNVGIVGHGGTGKTQLVSSLLFTRRSHATVRQSCGRHHHHRLGRRRNRPQDLPANRLGLRRMALHLCGGNTVKINFLDLPGYSTFITETKATLIAADAALITVDAHVGAQVTTEKVWDYCAEYDIPRAFVLTWMDRELSSFERSLASLIRAFRPQRRSAADAHRQRKKVSAASLIWSP